MKISAINIPAANNQYIKKQIRACQTAPSQTGYIFGSEMIGNINKSQVSFHGTNNMKNGIFTHDCSEKGIIKPLIKEHVEYNKSTGEFKHSQTDKYGNVISAYSYNPQTDTEIKTQTLSNGNIETITTTPAEIITEEKNPQRKEIYYLKKCTNGYFEERVTEYENQRQIINKGNDYNRRTEVIDLRTMQPVYRGALIYSQYTKDNVTYTENLLTGQIVKEEKYSDNGALQYLKEYSEDSQKLIRHKYAASKGYVDNEYYDNRFGSKKSETIESYDKTYKKVTKFDEYERITECTVYQGKTSGGKQSVTKLYPQDTTQIKERKIINGNETTIEYFDIYKKFPCKVKYYSDKFLESEITYNKITGQIETQKDYEPNGNYAVYEYSQGELDIGRLYNKQGQEYQTQYYKSGILTEEIVINLKNNHQTSYKYANDGKTLRSEEERDASGNPIESYTYYSDGQTVKTRRVYTTRDIYTETTYDKDGNVTGQKKYDNSRQRNNSYSYDFDFSSIFTDYTDTMTDEEFLEKMCVQLANDSQGQKSITEYQWKRFADIVGMKDYKAIKASDKKAIRELYRMYHPDISQHPYADTITKIINVLNEVNR